LARKATATAKKPVKNGKKANARAPQVERRRFERAPINAQVEYELTNSSSGPSRVRRNMANISTGGMFITTEERIRAGTRMVVRFELPNRHRVIAVSRVTYAKEGDGLGVEFLSLDEEDLEEIQTYIASMQESNA
jgi:c-di-GMP-binding flagellar brake protein YcgR